MQNIIDKIQKCIDTDPEYWVKVRDMDASKDIDNKVNKSFLATNCSGSFSTYLDGIKKTNVKRLGVTQRKKHGSSSVSAGQDVVISLEKQPEATQPPAHTAAPAVQVQAYGDPVTQMISTQLADEKIRSRSLETDNRGLTGDKNTLSLQQVTLKAEIKALEKELSTAQKDRRKARKKSKKPQGLAGIIPPDQTAAFIESLPELIASTAAAIKGQPAPALAVQTGENPNAKDPVLHAQICTALLQWPTNLLQELTNVMLKYQTNDDPQFVEKLRAMLNDQPIQQPVETPAA